MKDLRATRRRQRKADRADTLPIAQTEEEVLINLRARVIWYAAVTRFIRGNEKVTFKRRKLEQMLEMTVDINGQNVMPIIEKLPMDRVMAAGWDGDGIYLIDPVKGRAVVEGTDHRIRSVFDYWVEQTGRSNRTQLSTKRKNLIMLRLSEGYTEAQLKTAIDMMAQSEFHTKGGYLDMHHCLTPERLDRWLILAGNREATKTDTVEDIIQQTIARRLTRTNGGDK